jgi:phosphonate transport system permease protein
MTRYSASRRLLRRAGIAAVLLVLFVISAQRCEIRLDILRHGLGQGPQFIASFFPPLWSAAGEMVTPILITIVLAATATLLGLLLSFPIGLAAAANVAPAWLRYSVRVLLAVERAVPETILILFFVVAFGLGPLAGVCSLALSSIGMLGKLLGDAMEEVDPGIVESVRAAGATFTQTIRYGLLPQVLPALAAHTLFRFDVNVRNSVVLGAIGAGGIGEEIAHSMGMIQYERATIAVLGSLLVIYSAETLSGLLRRRLLGDGA